MVTMLRVIQRRDRFHFALEAVASFGIECCCIREHLEGDKTVEPRIARLVDLAHSPAAERRDDVCTVRVAPLRRMAFAMLGADYNYSYRARAERTFLEEADGTMNADQLKALQTPLKDPGQDQSGIGADYVESDGDRHRRHRLQSASRSPEITFSRGAAA